MSKKHATNTTSKEEWFRHLSDVFSANESTSDNYVLDANDEQVHGFDETKELEQNRTHNDMENSYPDNCSEAVVQPLHKKGDPNILDNYRGISLLNICVKLYSYIINKKLTQWIEENSITSESQAGFRKRYSTVDHLFFFIP